MVIIIVVIIVIWLVVVSNNNKANKVTEEQKKRKIEELRGIVQNIETSNHTKQQNTDTSIIDITEEDSINIYPYRNEQPSYVTSKVPYWPHSYVYSASHLQYANKAQKQFYEILKTKFLNGECLDIEGNSNYSFILLFDLFDEYESHLDIHKLREQIKLLGDNYPNTMSYGSDMLIALISKGGLDEDAMDLLIDDFPDYHWTLGQLYGKKLNLSNDERIILDYIRFSSSNFSNIEFCRLELIKLFFISLTALKKQYIELDTSLDEQFGFIADLIARKQFRYRNGSQNYNYCIETSQSSIYLNLFRVCDNSLRVFYGYKRKSTLDEFCNKPNITDVFETNIFDRFEKIIQENIFTLARADEDTAIELNRINTTRWRGDFISLEEKIESISPSVYFNEVLKIGKLNKKNPSLENIYYESSKKIAKIDKNIALKLYVYYIDADMRSVSIDAKPLTKNIQKSLFKNEDQIAEFENIISTLMTDHNIDNALSKVESFYKLKRKKVVINKDHIKEVNIQHSQTVELLNEYLKDDEVDIIIPTNNDNEEIKIKIQSQNTVEDNCLILLSDDLTLNVVQLKLVELFAKASLTLDITEVDKFAKEKGYFASQMIDSINESCYELIDDNLIEEEDDCYVINDEYYKIIIQ